MHSYKMKLNIGCGKDVKQGYVNVDYVKTPGVDLVLDIEKTPYPFKDNTFEEVVAFNILEHVRELVPVMEEIHRISRNGGVIKIKVPHYNQHLAYTDPTHVRFFSPETFNFFTSGKGSKKIFNHKTDDKVENFSSKGRFEMITLRLIPAFWGKLMPFQQVLRPLSYTFGEVVDSIYVELRVVK